MTSAPSSAVDCVAGRQYAFDRAHTALLVIDMQKDFIAAEGMAGQGGHDLEPLTRIVPRVSAVLEAGRREGLRIIHTREGYAPDLSDVNPLKRERSGAGRRGPLGRFLIRGEPGQDFLDELRPGPGELVIDKPGFGAFYRTDLEAHLRHEGITHLILMGVTTQCCVLSSLREAVDRGFWCLLLSDCCAAFDPEAHEATLTVIQAEDHLFGWISDSEALIAALSQA